MSGRIGKVRMKATGFEFRVLHGPAEPETDPGAKFMAASREIASDGSLCGFVVIGLTEDGGYRTALEWDAERSPIPLTLFPSYLAEVLRRRMITETEAHAVFDDMFQWVE